MRVPGFRRLENACLIVVYVVDVLRLSLFVNNGVTYEIPCLNGLGDLTRGSFPRIGSCCLSYGGSFDSGTKIFRGGARRNVNRFI